LDEQKINEESLQYLNESIIYEILETE